MKEGKKIKTKSEKEKDEFSNIMIFNKYLTDKKLGEGSFGKVYSGINVVSKEKVAIKLEHKEKEISLLEAEAYNMSYVKGDGIPQLYCYGYNTKYNILVMEILGDSVEHYFQKCGKKFSLATVLHLAVQMLERVKHVHEKNLVHRDLKPENFLTGYEDSYKKKIFLIDFGLCSKYRSSNTKEHIQMKTGKSLTGTVRYASINTHKGYEQSRRDDLESLGYILIYLMKSSLPWQGIRSKTIEEKFQRILDQKLLISIEDLCSNLPNEFSMYIEYCRNLQFAEDPNYNYLLSLFTRLMKRENIDPNLIEFDWFANGDISFTSGYDNLSRLNRSANNTGIVRLDKNNQSANISQIQNKLNNSTNDIIQKKPSLISGVRRKNTSVSSKKVSFGRVEIVKEGYRSQSPDGKQQFQEIIIKELPKETDIKCINYPGEERRDKKKNNNCCFIF